MLVTERLQYDVVGLKLNNFNILTYLRQLHHHSDWSVGLAVSSTIVHMSKLKPNGFHNCCSREIAISL